MPTPPTPHAASSPPPPRAAAYARSQVPPKTSASGQSCISSPLPMAGAVAEDEYEEDWAAPDYDLKAEQAALPVPSP